MASTCSHHGRDCMIGSFVIFLAWICLISSRRCHAWLVDDGPPRPSFNYRWAVSHLYDSGRIRRRSINPRMVRRAAATDDTASALPSHATSSSLIQAGRTAFASCFPFELDDWQLQAGGAVVEGFHVIVCAPTGAGKTVIGEMALRQAFVRQRRGIYTTPLKALSNQKYAEFCQTFGREQVGLSTGDVSLNKGANVTVMTTEVYRNLAWRHESTGDLQQTSVVVLDEFHYMGFQGRGGVWEESVITSPAHVQLVALSATLSNAQQLANWMESVTNRTTVLVQVPVSQRPVPLRYLFATKEGLFPLFRDPDAGPGAPHGLLGLRGEDEAENNEARNGGNGPSRPGFGSSSSRKSKKVKLPRGLQLNPALRAAAEKRMQRVNRAMVQQRAQPRWQGHHGSKKDRNRSDESDFDFGRRRQSGPLSTRRKLSPKEERKERERLLKREMRRAVPKLNALVKRLEQRDLLPAIFFIFSRAQCDDAARSLFRRMQGPRDHNRLSQQDELEEQHEFPMYKEEKPKRQTRRRGDQARRSELFEDKDGRVFRRGSNYISEDILTSTYEVDSQDVMTDFDETTPLASSNWNFCAKAGLLSYDEIRDVAQRISNFNEENPEIAFDTETIEQLLFGAGAHHAGMLPAHKSFVEVLFRNGLMKVVFATETLAAGINMPARTTVICALAKRGDGGSSMNLLETSNLLQMAGRAGRRGMDTDGTCVIVATPFETHDDAAKILTDPIKPISSQFSPSYALAVNLIERGNGKLEVARQLVSKSFANWEIQRIRTSEEVVREDDSVPELLSASAQERFMTLLVDILGGSKSEIDGSILERLKDRELLKSTSKSFLGIHQMMELERTTLDYLEREYESMRHNDLTEEESLLVELRKEDEENLVQQIEQQRERLRLTEADCAKHPFTLVTEAVNTMMSVKSPVGELLQSALQTARRKGNESNLADEVDESIVQTQTESLTPMELVEFSKAALVVRRKAKQLAKLSSQYDTRTASDEVRDDSWNDMLSITRVLVAYGCLLTNSPFSDGVDLEQMQYALTPAGVNVGMVRLDNSLWSLVAMGGAWDVVGASFKLDARREVIDASGDTDWYGEEMECRDDTSLDVPRRQQEAEMLASMLRSMTASEMAGYVSALVSDNPRDLGPSVVDLFQRLTLTQQKVIQSSLLAMERLTEVQKVYAIDENARRCTLDITNCGVVTAWASGCSWNEALELSGSPPGDLVRTMSRAMDALRQFGNLAFTPIRKGDFGKKQMEQSPGIHPEVRRLCREGARLLNRYPVKDPLAFEVADEDEFDQDDEDTDEVMEDAATEDASSYDGNQ